MHRDADCLSRHPVDPPDPTGNDDFSVFALSDLLNIADHQRRDPSLRKIIERLTSEPTDPSMRAFVIRDGILFRRNFRADGPDELLAVPSISALTSFASFTTRPQPVTLAWLGLMTACVGAFTGRACTGPCGVTSRLVTLANAEKRLVRIQQAPFNR